MKVTPAQQEAIISGSERPGGRSRNVEPFLPDQALGTRTSESPNSSQTAVAAPRGHDAVDLPGSPSLASAGTQGGAAGGISDVRPTWVEIVESVAAIPLARFAASSEMARWLGELVHLMSSLRLGEAPSAAGIETLFLLLGAAKENPIAAALGRTDGRALPKLVQKILTSDPGAWETLLRAGVDPAEIEGLLGKLGELGRGVEMFKTANALLLKAEGLAFVEWSGAPAILGSVRLIVREDRQSDDGARPRASKTHRIDLRAEMTHLGEIGAQFVLDQGLRLTLRGSEPACEAFESARGAFEAALEFLGEPVALTIAPWAGAPEPFPELTDLLGKVKRPEGGLHVRA